MGVVEIMSPPSSSVLAGEIGWSGGGSIFSCLIDFKSFDAASWLLFADAGEEDLSFDSVIVGIDIMPSC